jgi:hypothetical protein
MEPAMKTTTIRPELHSDWAAVLHGGLQYEISAEVDGAIQPLVKVVADDADESRWVQVQAGAAVVEIPIAYLRDALAAADAEVHSESWYQRNLPPDQEP